MSPHRNIRVLTWFNFFSSFRLFAAILILYFQRITGSYALAMSIISVVFISTALLEVPTGIFSDRIGRKNTMILGALSGVLAVVFYAIGISYWILVVGAIFEGLGRSFFSGNNTSLLHDTLREHNQEQEYSHHLGQTSSMFQVASAVSAVLGGFIAYISFPLVMWLSVIPQVISVLLSTQLIEPKVHTKKTGNVFQHLNIAIKKTLENKKLRLLTIAGTINYGVGEAAYEFKAAFYNLVWPTWALGIPRTVSGVAAAVSYYFGGKIIKRFTPIKVIITDTISTPIITTLAAIFITPLSPIFMALTSLFYGSANVAENTLFHQEFTNEQRATMASLQSFTTCLLIALSSFILGVIADIWGIVPALVCAQAVLLANTYFYKRAGSLT
ncbi:hypothetical protein A3B46_03230 [Candidatus Roizmanbacteria bacterium RIFCSPLOWO2_01_FULL_39_19]|nr:MAG: hypothetical protein A3B46_03230 [Candidatus Roizmanbacteria bacterium RIFCSPLOWO2_01_FULL_39_19]